MSAPIALSPMAPRHIEAVRSIDELVYSNAWSVRTWRNELSSPDRLHLVAFDGERIVGHAGLLFVLEEVHVTTVAVDPEREGEGIGSALLAEVLGDARRHGSRAATLEVRASHERPQRLYARFGFRPAGVRRRYYGDPLDDAVVMWMHDLDSDEAGQRIAAAAAAPRRAGDPS